ncbi:MAG: hypothetical protein Q8928_01380 [Bacteroidota bacterium]|nr:hypothetical protein [Bacteroidota bacterium]
MKKLYLIGIICFWLSQLSCEDQSSTPEKISSEESKDLIREWIYSVYNPDMSPSLIYSVEEITTNEIWSKMRAQVFTITTDVPGLSNRALFIKNGKVYDLGRNNLLGAHKPENFLVVDLNRDSLYELCFTLTHGSGLIRSEVVWYSNDLNDTYLFADTSFLSSTNLKLEKEDYQNVLLKQVNTYNEVIIGSVSLVQENGTLKLKIISNKEQ